MVFKVNGGKLMNIEVYDYIERMPDDERQKALNMFGTPRNVYDFYCELYFKSKQQGVPFEWFIKMYGEK
jgi:hypothetical protein